MADEILELQQAFDDAELRGDDGRLGDLLADDFLSIGEQGYQLGKRECIDRHRDFRYLSIETTEVDVRRYGTTAIVRCAQRSRASWRGEEMTLSVSLDPAPRWMAARRHPVQHTRLSLNRHHARQDHATQPATASRSSRPPNRSRR